MEAEKVAVIALKDPFMELFACAILLQENEWLYSWGNFMVQQAYATIQCKGKWHKYVQNIFLSTQLKHGLMVAKSDRYM